MKKQRRVNNGERDETEYTRAIESSGTAHETIDIHRLLIASVRDYAIFVLDPAGNVLTWNIGAERLKGYLANEIVGKHFSIFYPPEEVERGHPEYELRTAEAEGRYQEEGWRVRKDGSLFWASVTITALRDEEGHLVGFAKVTHDLTDRRAAELKAIEDARRIAEAEAANRAKSEFLAAMSHELRTPLNAIGGYVDLLTYGVHGALSDAQRSALERVRASQQHLLALINDLLNFSKVETGRITYQQVPVALGELAREATAMVKPQALSKSIAVVWQESDSPVIARADRARVEQILLNLLTNAIKYTEPGGRVEVLESVRGDRAVIEVSDNGIGIPTEHLDAIFEPFTQVGRSLTSSHDGTGLGLAISRHLARAMYGDLTAESTVGEGSTFTLSLPAAD